MRNYSKVLLATVLAGALALTGCGTSNPTSALTDTSTSTNTATDTNTNTDTQTDTYTISGSVVPTYTAPDAVFEVTLTDSNNVSIKQNGKTFKFTDQKAGSYTLTAKETKNGNYTLLDPISVELLADKTDISIPMAYNGPLPKFSFSGNIVDSFGKGISFCEISSEKMTSSVESMPDSGKFGILDLYPGTYELVVSKTSFEDTKVTLYIDNEGKNITINDTPVTEKIDFRDPKSGETINCFNLGDISMAAKLAGSGALKGILIDPATNQPVTNGTTFWIYRSEDPTSEPVLVGKKTTKDETGYFSIDNLQPGNYCGSNAEIHSVGDGAPEWKPSKSGGNITGYNLPADKQLFTWIKVNEKLVSTLPRFN